MERSIVLKSLTLGLVMLLTGCPDNNEPDVIVDPNNDVDDSPPEVVTVSPPSNQAAVNPGDSLAITFSEPMERETVADTFVCGEGVESTQVSSTENNNRRETVFELTPNESLAGTTTSCSYSDVDENNNTVQETYEFSVNELPNVAPTISVLNVSDIPSGGSIVVDIRAVDSLGFEGIPTITACSQGGVSFTQIGSDADFAEEPFVSNTTQAEYRITAPTVSAETPYACEVSAMDDAGLTATQSFSGVIVPPSTAVFDAFVVRPFNDVFIGAEFPTNQTRIQTPNGAAATDYYGGHFDSPSIGISAVSLPTLSRDCLSSIEGVTENNQQGTAVAFSCPLSGDGAQTTVSLPGQGFWDVVDDASNTTEIIEFTQSGNGLTSVSSAAFDDFNDDIFLDEGQSVQLRDNEGNASSPIILNPLIEVSTVDAFGNDDVPRLTPAITFAEANGLSSVLNVSVDGEFDEVSVFLYTDVSATQLNGFFIVIDVPEANGAASVDVNMVPSNLVAHIEDNNIVVNDIVVVGANTDSEGSGNSNNPRIFTGGNPEDPPSAPPPASAGLSINTSLETLTPAPVCPLFELPQASVPRCAAGNSEVLLSINSASEVATYSSYTGEHISFALQGEDFSHLGTNISGLLASQAPDNCIVYANDEGHLLLFNSASGNEQILGDGQGSLANGTEALLNGSMQANNVVSYRGFDFYTPDNGQSWNMFIATQRSDNAGTFTNEIIRYDYAVSGDTVLSNPLVIASDVAASNQASVFYSVAVLGQQVFVTQDLAAGPDIIRVFDIDGTEQTPLFDINSVRAGSEDIREIRQIVPYLERYLAVVNFSAFTPAIRVIEAATPGQTLKSVALLDQIRGVQPLYNGDFIVGGEEGLDRTVVNTFNEQTRRVPDLSARTTFNRQGYQIGRACLP